MACTVCGRLSDQRRCEQHRRDTRPPSPERGYDSVWRRIRDRYLAAHEICETEGCDQPATDVHHIDGKGPRGDNSDTNLLALCHSHHSRITAREGGGFGRETRGTRWDEQEWPRLTG